MRKTIFIISFFIFTICLLACNTNMSKTTREEAICLKVVSKFENKIDLTQEQKDQIKELTLKSGIASEVQRNFKARAKYKELITKIRSEVLSVDQLKRIENE
jgi:hypothetical protein